MYPMTARVAMQKKCQLSTETNNNKKNNVVFKFKSVFQESKLLNTRAKKRVKTDTVLYLCQYFMIRNTQYEVVVRYRRR